MVDVSGRDNGGDGGGRIGGVVIADHGLRSDRIVCYDVRVDVGHRHHVIRLVQIGEANVSVLGFELVAHGHALDDDRKVI